MYLPARLLTVSGILLTTLLMHGCEGGKNQGAGCGSPYGQCDTGAKPCPAGQESIEGKCQAPDNGCPTGQHWQDNGCVADQLSVEIVSQASCWNASNGATRLILQFITRDQKGLAIDPEVDTDKNPTAVSSQLYVDDEPADVEALLSQDSELLKSNMALSLVLDSTYSMLHHNPPAFEPMKAAAVDVLKEVQAAWATNGAEFHWELAWFNDVIFRPAANNRGESWQIADIAYLPQPTQGDFTGLWKAVHYTIGVHENLYQNKVAAGSRDQHVMIVFSDGDDNHSYFNNSDARYSGAGDLNGMLHWTYQGYMPTTIEDIKARLTDFPGLRVYVIAFGAQLGEKGKKDLRSLAEQSRGQYFFGSDGETLTQLFDSVKREFVTMQTLGIETPLQDGEHKFSLRTQHLASGAEGGLDFSLQVSEQNLGTCATSP